MAGEKYIVATINNSIPVSVKNILNPAGYVFLGKCGDAASLLRSIRSLQPAFIVVDMASQIKEIERVIYTADDEMLCSCILIGEPADYGDETAVANSKVVSFVNKNLGKEIFTQTVSLAIMNFRRVSELSRQLDKMTENYESRKLVERAKGYLIEHEGLSESAAYEKIRKKSMNNRLSMKSMALTIIKAYEKNGK